MKTIKMNDYTIKIVQDEHAESPDSWGNDDAFIIYGHRQFNVQRKGFDGQEIFDHIQESKTFFYDGYFVFPVYAYIHSGVVLSLGKTTYPFTCGFDTSMRGFCFVKKAKDLTQYLQDNPETKTRDYWEENEARTVAEGIIETWNTYLSGEIYGYQIEDKDGNDLDSCWGYYSEEHAIEDAQTTVACYIKRASEKRVHKLKNFIRNHVPLEIRQSLLNA